MRFVLFAATLFTLSGCASVANQSTAEADVIAAIHSTVDAYRRGDAAGIAAGVTEDFTLTDQSGSVTTVKDDIETARSGAVRYEVFENYDMKVRLYGDTAIVLGKTRVTGSAGTTRFASVYQFTDTLIRRDGRWLFAASHISKLVE